MADSKPKWFNYEKLAEGIVLSTNVVSLYQHGTLLEIDSYSKVEENVEPSLLENSFDLNSDCELKIYDACKYRFGLEQAVELRDKAYLSDGDGDSVQLKPPPQEKEIKGYVKYLCSQNCVVQLNDENVALSRGSAKLINAIESNIRPDSNSKASSLCIQFLQDIGSHYQTGSFNVGGLFEWVCVWNDTQTSGQPYNKEACVAIVDACSKLQDTLEGSDVGKWYNVPILCKKYNLKMSTSIPSDKLSSYRVRVTKRGGNRTSTTQKQWKEDVLKNIGALAVIVKSNRDSKVTPIWKLVEKEGMKFQNVTKLAAFLKSTWISYVKNKEPSSRVKLLALLDLTKYNDIGISLHDVRSLHNTASDIDSSFRDLPWIILENLLSVDYRCRDDTLKKFYKQERPHIKGQAQLHAMDVIMLVFTSCDMMLRQLLVQKMSMCRLAIPFVIPYPGNRLQLSLWPLRSIVMEWISATGKASEASLINHCFQIISFVRLGKISLSKSSLMNDILSESDKKTFFHKDCYGGSEERSISNGLVEITYYLPSGKEDSLQKELVFLNLRGDGHEFERQLSLISKISTVVVCLIDIDYLSNKQAVKKLSGLGKNNARIIVLVTSYKHDRPLDFHECMNNLRGKENLGQLKGVLGFNPGRGPRTGEELTSETVEVISNAIKGIDKPSVPLVDCKNACTMYDISVDEDLNKVCVSTVKPVCGILHEIENNDLTSCKRKMLPLQGEVRHKWVNILKKQHRGGKEYLAEELLSKKSDLGEEMHKLRGEQMKMANRLHSAMNQFLTFQREAGNVTFESDFFLKRLQISLDDVSRCFLPTLRKVYEEKWAHRNKPEGAKELRDVERKMDESSLGKEHLFREAGQLYESMIESKANLLDHQQKMVADLPRLAAQDILAGHPFEVMDGDAGVVPLTWIKAVLYSLQEVIGEKTMFVLSVAGIQSSGKSTFLNAMFGLEMAVGAGRCTRGIYAQLLPADPNLELPVDYVLILDSEGLCATESVDAKYEHDNELATLVIGLSDLTFINSKGENIQQMKEILQIAVHAFLRMKVVNKYKKQKCIFIHQAVSSVMAPDRLRQSQYALQESLDQMTKEAAEAENVQDTFHTLSHVIEFDCEQHVHYIPDLWTGEAPMVRVNPKYSETVRKIKQILMREVKQSECHVTASDLQTRIEDIWNGVLADDFLFSFRNCLTLKAYLSLEKTFYMLIRQLESTLMQFINSECKGQIEVCTNEAMLHKCHEEMKTEFDKVYTSGMSAAKINLEKFFINHNHKELLLQWKNEKIQSLSLSGEVIQNQLKLEIKGISDTKMVEVKLLQDAESHKKRLLGDAITLAKNLEGQVLSEDVISTRFRGLWNDWVMENKLEDSFRFFNVRDEMQDVLMEIFATRGHTKYLKEEMQEKWDSDYADSENANFQESDMIKEHVAQKDLPQLLAQKGMSQESGKLWKPTVLSKSTSREVHFAAVVMETNQMLQDIFKTLKDIAKEYDKFLPFLGHKVIGMVMEHTDKLNAKPFNESPFTLTPQFEAMVVVRVAKIATVKFEEMNANYSTRHSAHAKIQAYEGQLFSLFKSKAGESHSAMANSLLQKLVLDTMSQSICDQVKGEIGIKVVDYVLDDFDNIKYRLIARILKSLAEKESFDTYMEYASDSFTYATGWINNYIEKLLFESTHDATMYLNLAKQFLETSMNTIKTAAEKATSQALGVSTNKLSVWIDTFADNISTTIPLTKSQADLMKKYEVEDIQCFEASLLKDLGVFQHQLISEYSATTAESVQWKGMPPQHQIITRLWGCQERCPFCMAPCQFTDPEHSKENANGEITQKHESAQHWPAGFGGTFKVVSQKLVIDICSFSVASGGSFRCSASRNKCREGGNCSAKGNDFNSHEYKDYKRFLPQWDIKPDDSGTASKYWQWFMFRFKGDLVKYHKVNAPDIPLSWGRVSKEEAIKSLNVYID